MTFRIFVVFIACLISFQSYSQNMEVIVDRMDFGYDVAQFSEGLLRVKSGDKWGFIDESGQWVIQPRFKEANDFSEGYAAVKIGTKYGYIDQSGTLVIAARYLYASSFSEGVAQVVFVRKQSGYIEKTGQIAFVSNDKFKCLKDEISSNGLIKVIGPNQKYGYADKYGTLVVNPQFDRAYAFIDGLAAVGVGKKVGFINDRGQFIISPKYDVIKRFKNGYTGVCVGNRWGIIENSAKSEIIRPRFSDVQSFYNGRAAVCVNNKWGYINKYGEMVISPKFTESAPFNNHLTPVCMNDKWGYMDSNGNMAIRAQYKNPNRKANAFNNGMEIAYVGNKCGVIDEHGNFIVSPRYDCIYFSGNTPGLAIVMNTSGGQKSYQLVRIRK